jgi:hypothetical protein
MSPIEKAALILLGCTKNPDKVAAHHIILQAPLCAMRDLQDAAKAAGYDVDAIRKRVKALTRER